MVLKTSSHGRFKIIKSSGRKLGFGGDKFALVHLGFALQEPGKNRTSSPYQGIHPVWDNECISPDSKKSIPRDQQTIFCGLSARKAKMFSRVSS